MQRSEKQKLVEKLRRAADAQRRAYPGNLYHEGIAQGIDNAAGIIGKVRCDDAPSEEARRAGKWIEDAKTSLEEAAQRIAEIESVDAVEVVRCKDCRFFKGDGLECYWGLNAYEDDYCSHGVRKEEKQ